MKKIKVVTKGGAWFNPAARCRPAFRGWNSKFHQGDNVGVRLALKRHEKNKSENK